MWPALLVLLLSTTALTPVRGVQELPADCKNVVDAAALSSALSGNGNNELTFCLQQPLTFEEQPAFQVRAGQKVSIYCGARKLNLYSSQGPAILDSGSQLDVYDCDVSFFKNGYSAMNAEVSVARDMTRTTLIGQSGSVLRLTDSSLLMPRPFPEIFFKDIIQRNGEQQQQASPPDCETGPHVFHTVFDAWAITLQSLNLPTGFAPDNNAYGLEVNNVTLWCGPYEPQADRVIEASIEISEDSTQISSCMQLENEAVWPSVELQGDAKDTSAGGDRGGPEEAAGGLTRVPSSVLPSRAGDAEEDRRLWIIPVVIVICILCVIVAFAVGYWAKNYVRPGGKYMQGDAAPVFAGHDPPPNGEAHAAGGSKDLKALARQPAEAGAHAGGVGALPRGAPAPGVWQSAFAAARAAVGGVRSGSGRSRSEATAAPPARRGSSFGNAMRSSLGVRASSTERSSIRSDSERRSSGAAAPAAVGGLAAASAKKRRQQEFSVSSARIARSMHLGECGSSGAQIPLLDTQSHPSYSNSTAVGHTVKEQVGNAIRKMEGELLQQGEATVEEQLKIDSIIGRGAFGTVYKGQWRGLKVAIKTVVFQSDLVDGPISRVASETVIASNLIHQNIVATYSHDISAVSKAGDGEPELGVYKFYLIQEYCNAGSLRMAISSGRFLQPRMKGGRWRPLMGVLQGVVCGMQYMHSKGICHGDLNPSNILLKTSIMMPEYSENGNGQVGSEQIQAALNDLQTSVKLTDFGMSTRMDTKCSHRSNINHGTAFYIAPEVIWQQRLHRASDVYSFGVIMWEVMTGTPVFIRRTDTPPGDQKVANANSFVHHPAFPSLPVTVPLTFTLTMKACLSETPSERPTFGQIATIFEDVLFEVDTGTYINSNGHVMLSEGAQQDPTDFPPQDLLIESPIPSRLPSSVGENQLPSSITTDYPGPSSAASWARAQQAAQNTQNTQNTQITSNTQATQTTQNNAPVQYGYGKPPTYGGGYTGSTVPAPSSGPSPLSENYGPLPPSSRGGVSGYSGTSRMSLSSQLLRSSFQEVLADVPAAPQPPIQDSADVEIAHSEPGNFTVNSSLPHPVTPEPNPATPDNSGRVAPVATAGLTGLSNSGHNTFFTASAGATGGTQRSHVASEQFVSADEGFSPPQSNDSDIDPRASWLLQPSPAEAASKLTPSVSGFSNSSNPINMQSGMPQPLKPYGTDDVHTTEKIRQLGRAAKAGANLPNDGLNCDGRFGFGEAALPDSNSLKPQPESNAEISVDIPDVSESAALNNEASGAAITSSNSGEGTGSLSVPARPVRLNHNDSAALSLSDSWSNSAYDSSEVQEVTLAVASLDKASAAGSARTSRRNSRALSNTKSVSLKPPPPRLSPSFTYPPASHDTATASVHGAAAPGAGADAAAAGAAGASSVSAAAASAAAAAAPLMETGGTGGSTASWKTINNMPTPEYSQPDAEEFMTYNGIGNMSLTSEREHSHTHDDSIQDGLPVRASASELQDQSAAFGASSAQQLENEKEPQKLIKPKLLKPPKPPRALHAFGRTLRPAARSLKSESDNSGALDGSAPLRQTPPDGNSSNLDSIIRANARRAMEAAQQRLGEEAAERGKAVKAAENKEREGGRRIITRSRRSSGNASTTSIHLCEGSKSSTVHEAHASEAGPSGGGGSGPSGSSSRQLLLGPSRRSDTDVVGTSHSSLKPSHYEVLEGHSELHTEEAVSATNHYPLAQLDDAAEEIADVHSVNPLDPGASAVAHAQAAALLKPQAHAPEPPMQPPSNPPQPRAAAAAPSPSNSMNWKSQVLMHAHKRKEQQKVQQNQSKTSTLSFQGGVGSTLNPPEPRKANRAHLDAAFATPRGRNSANSTKTLSDTQGSSITARSTRSNRVSADSRMGSISISTRVSAEPPRTPPAGKAPAAVDVVNLLHGTTSSHGEGPTAAETAAAAAAASAAAAATRSTWHTCSQNHSLHSQSALDSKSSGLGASGDLGKGRSMHGGHASHVDLSLAGASGMERVDEEEDRGKRAAAGIRRSSRDCKRAAGAAADAAAASTAAAQAASAAPAPVAAASVSQGGTAPPAAAALAAASTAAAVQEEDPTEQWLMQSPLSQQPDFSPLSSLEPEETASLPAPSAVARHLGAQYPSQGGLREITRQNPSSPPKAEPSDAHSSSAAPKHTCDTRTVHAARAGGLVTSVPAVHATSRKSHHKAWQEHLQTMQELNFPRQTSMERTASHNHAAVEAGIPESIPEALQLQVPQTLNSKPDIGNPASGSSAPRPGVPLAASQPNSSIAGTSTHDQSGLSSGTQGGGSSGSRYGYTPNGDKIPIIRRIWA